MGALLLFLGLLASLPMVVALIARLGDWLERRLEHNATWQRLKK